ncbi:MAG: InlB B-repeat-containing protein [Bacteroidales bacterium]
MKKHFQLLALIALVISAISFNSCRKDKNNDDANGGDTATSYTVTFDANGGGGTAPAPITAKKGEAVTLPTSEGMTAPEGKPNFLGWDIKKDAISATFAAGAELTTDADITLYAIWSDKVIYTVTFDANDGAGTAPAPMIVEKEASITLPAQGTMTAPEGKPNFAGWDTDKAATTATFAAKADYTPTANITLYAIWTAGSTATSFTVTFDINGATGEVPKAKVVQRGEALKFPSTDELDEMTAPEDKPNFVGWNTTADATESLIIYIPTKDITLYAIWTDKTPIYTVTFDLNGGSGTVPSPIPVASGEEITIPGQGAMIAPNNTDKYVLKGWDEDKNATRPEDVEDDSYNPNANLYLYAIWGTSFLRELQEDYITLPIADFDTKLKTLKFTLKTETAIQREYEQELYDNVMVTYTIDFSGTKINKLTYSIKRFPNSSDTRNMREWKREAYVLYPNSFTGKMTINGVEQTYNLSQKEQYEAAFKENVINFSKASEATVSITNDFATVTSGLRFTEDVLNESFIEVIRNQ